MYVVGERVSHSLGFLRSRFQFCRCHLSTRDGFCLMGTLQSNLRPEVAFRLAGEADLGTRIYRVNAVIGGSRGMSAQLCRASHNILMRTSDRESHIDSSLCTKMTQVDQYLTCSRGPIVYNSTRCSMTHSTKWCRKHVMAGPSCFPPNAIPFRLILQTPIYGMVNNSPKKDPILMMSL